MLKFVLDNLDGLDESIAKMYTEQDGKFFLNVEGAVSKDKLSEFRNKNIQLMEDLDKFKDVDLEKYNQALTKMSDLDRKKTISMDKVDGLLAERVQAMKAEMQETIDGLTNQNGTLTSQLESLVIDSAVRAAAGKHKVTSSAVDDVVLRAKSTFKMDKGKAMPYDSEGNVIYDKDGQTPLTVDNWVKGLEKSASHLFVSSQGGGAPPGGNGNIPPGMKVGDMTSLQKISAGLQKD